MNKMKKILAGILSATLMVTSMNLSAFTMQVQAKESVMEADGSAYVLQSGGLLQQDGQLSVDDSFSLEGSSLNFDSTNVKGAMEAIKKSLENFDASCNISQYQIPVDDAAALFWEVLNTNPNYFYVTSRISCSYSGTDALALKFTYLFSGSELAAKQAEYERAVAEALSGVNASWTDMEKALYLHDYIVDNCKYDLTYSKYSSYNIFVEKTAVCQGYSLAYKDLMNRVNIPCQIVTSDSANHAWNLLKLDGNYYYVDTTWDDPTPDLVGRVRHTNFLKSYANFSASKHMKSNDWEVSGSWISTCATDTTYDSSFFDTVNVGFRNAGNYWYALADGKINKYQYSGGSWNQSGSALYTITDRWPSSGGGNWIGTFSGLSLYKGLLYFNTPQAIYSIQPDSGAKELVYSLTSAQKAIGNIYGLFVDGAGNVKCELSPSPNDSGQVVVVTNLYSSTSCVEHVFTNQPYTDLGNGKHNQKCKNCDTYSSAVSHSFTVENTKIANAKISDATCSQKAKYYKSCVCGKLSSNVADVFFDGELAEHQFTVKLDENQHKCLNCDEKENHSFIAADGSSVTSNQSCTVCNANNINYSGLNAMVSVSPLPYTGSAQKPTILITGLVENKDFTVEVTAQKEPGSNYKATIKGKGEYAGKRIVTWSIGKAAASVKVAPTAKTLSYTGAPQELVTAGTAVGGTLKYSTTKTGTYTTSIPTGTNVGAYSVWYKVEADESHTDLAPAKVSVTIAQKSITPTVADIADVIYDGQEKTPNIDVKDGTNSLVKNRDYIVLYSNNVNAGTATATIKAVAGSNYKFNDLNKTFTIKKAKSPTVNDTEVSYLYTTTGQKTVTLALSDLVLGNVTGVATIADPYDILGDAATFRNNGVTFTLKSSGAEKSGKSATIAVKITSQNHEDFTVNLVVSLNGKANQTAPSCKLTFEENQDDTFTAKIAEVTGAEYSFDGTTWSSENTMTVQPNTLVRAYIRLKETDEKNASPVATDEKTSPKLMVETPSISPNGGTFEEAQTVAIFCETEEAVIHYTLDGGTPTLLSPIYTEPFIIEKTTEINAIAIKENMDDSEVASALFTIQNPDEDPVIVTPKPTAPVVGTEVNVASVGARVKVVDAVNKKVIYTAPLSKTEIVTIPDKVIISGVEYKVTKIAAGAFENNTTLTTVTVGNNVTEIGENAFKGCTKLKKVSISKAVVEIGNGAFKGCSSITKITIPSNVKKIGSNAFADCKKLKSITIPSKVTSIASNVLKGCKNLKTITINTTKLTANSVSKNAFKGITKGTVIKVPKSKLKAYKKLFAKKGLSSKVSVKAK